MPEPDRAAPADAAADLAVLREAAAEAGRVAMGYFGKKQDVWMKGGTSPVGEADYAADRCLMDMLLAARPFYGWLSEETEENRQPGDGTRGFIVDPIDGTRGFLAGHPHWCVSVAVVENGVALAGVLRCPATGETYEAVRGGGATLNGAPIRVAAQEPQQFTLGGPKAMADLLPPAWKRRVRPFAYVPSLAYRIAMIAAGRLDASFVKPDAHDWDIAAASLILEEAGGHMLAAGRVPPLIGSDGHRHPALAAGSGALLDAMVEVLGEYREAVPGTA